MLASVAMWASAGELAPVACDPGLAGFPPVMLYGDIKDKAGPGVTGLSDRAHAGPLQSPGGNRGEGEKVTVQAALDYGEEGAAEPDLLLLDFTGKGTFDRSRAIALRPMAAAKPAEHQTEFGPSVVSVVRRGKEFPLAVRGMQVRMGAQRMVMVMIALAVQGTCRFAQKQYSVRLIDSNGDFRFDRKGTYDRDHPESFQTGIGDTISIDTPDGAFGRPMAKAYYGQPVCVDGQWYDVAVSPDGEKVEATKTQVSAGHVQADAERWELVLEHAGRLTMLVGGRDPVPVPAGTYAIVYCRRWSAPDAKGRRAWLAATNNELLGGKENSVRLTVQPGQELKVPIGSSLKAELKATVAADGKVTFALGAPSLEPGLAVGVITDRSGWLTSHPDPPKVAVADQTGKVVGEVTLEYG